jgi:hypothetical protein
VTCSGCQETFHFLATLANKPLTEFGRRMLVLLENERVQNEKPIQASIDDLLGAVYSLIHAKSHQFVHRTGQVEIPVVKTRARQIQFGVVRTDGRWIAGWHFNSALFRLAAVYHRLLKAVTGEDENVADLLQPAREMFLRQAKRNWENKCIHKIYQEVNCLKHSARGLYFSRRATFADAVSSIEELLRLAEAWAKSVRSPVTNR